MCIQVSATLTASRATQSLYLTSDQILNLLCVGLRAVHLQEIEKAVEPKDGKQGTVPPKQEREGYVADLDE